MAPPNIPADVRRLVLDHIGSVEQLEVLLLLYNTPERWWSAAEVQAELRTSLTSAADRLHDLAERRFLAVEPSPPRYRFEAEEKVRRVVGLLAETYREYRVTVVAMIYSKPPDAVRELADAFRLGRGKTDG